MGKVQDPIDEIIEEVTYKVTVLTYEHVLTALQTLPADKAVQHIEELRDEAKDKLEAAIQEHQK